MVWSNSMSDFFRRDISEEYRDTLFETMTETASAYGHTFMVLIRRTAIELA